MGVYSLAEAKQQLDRLVEEALTGEVVTITRDGEPIATLEPRAKDARRGLVGKDLIARARRLRARRPDLGGDAVKLVREMRDEDE